MHVDIALYEERYKSGCKRVLKVLKDAGLNPCLANPRKGTWQVRIPKEQYERANHIVWGDDGLLLIR